MSASSAAKVRTRVPRFAEAAVERARLTVVPRRRVRAPRLPFVTLVSGLLLGGVVGLLCFNTQMQQASFAATSLEEQATALSAREQTLRAELREMQSPQRLAELAQQRGLVIPPSTCTIELTTGATKGGCAPASADSTPPLHAKPPAKPKILAGHSPRVPSSERPAG